MAKSSSSPPRRATPVAPSRKKSDQPPKMVKGGSERTPRRQSRAWRILVANGVNLDLLGQREAQHYGSFTLAEVEAQLVREAPLIAKAANLEQIELSFFQSNDEAAFLREMDRGWDGVVLNAAAWTHTSLALADRLRALSVPFVETHISNLAAREPFRHHSYLAPLASGVVYGFGMNSYRTALFGLCLNLAARPR